MADKILKSLNFGTEDDYHFAQSANRINGVISVENGGLGATTADEARRNIGAASEVDLNKIYDLFRHLELSETDDGKGNLTIGLVEVLSTYIPLEYIKSTGTQYIDLGITPSDDMEFEIEYQSLATSNTKLYGCEAYASSIFDAYAVTTKSATIRAFAHSGQGGTLTNITTIEGQKNTLKLVIKDGTNKIYVNGELIATAPVGGTVPNLNIFLFAVNRNLSAEGKGPQIIWSCTIKKSNELVGNFRPFLVDGEPGFLNVIDNSFHSNLGTGTFEYLKAVPDDYIPLEYIKSTGTQYIDLGITPSDDMEFEVTYQVTSGSGKLYGAELSGLIFDAFNVTPKSGIVRAFRHSNTGGTVTNITTVENEKVTLKVIVKDGSYSTYINGKLVNTAPAVGVPPNDTMYLFACNRGGKADALIKAINWGCIVKKSGKLVGDFRQYLNNDGEAGLINVVDMEFHPNIGTGEFEYEVNLDNYVKDSLIIWLDGIKNTRSGHNANAAEWEDLVGPYSFTKTNVLSFGDNHILTTGGIESKYGVIIPDEYTLEIIYQYNGTGNYGIGFMQNAPLLRGRSSQVSWWMRQNLDNDTTRLYYRNKFEINAPHSIAITQNADGGKCYHNGVLNNSNSKVFSYSGYQKIRTYISGEAMTGKIYAIRLHKRALTEEELARNYKIDVARFGLAKTVSTSSLSESE